MDVWNEAKRSAVMAQIRAAGTRPERMLLAIVRQALPRHRIHENDRRLPGAPDIVIPSLRLVILAHGCFWHMCPVHGRIPDSRREYWEPKLRGNVQRDRRNVRALRRAGWSVWTVWECEFRNAAARERTARILLRRIAARVERMRAAAVSH